ncbi:MAG: hypothetical protein CSA15_10300 [Candidatus Delongbacteria bacterium]|nr:MAG: hypothetical protein CSA15_10300 [Candidatus Delongbacteria bacterium]
MKIKMKKYTFILILSLISISINSQSSKIKFGLKSGINLSKYTPEQYAGNLKLANYQRKVGFYIGGFTNIKVSEKIKIQPELLFFTQGTKQVFENITLMDSDGIYLGAGDIEEKISESVISLPVVLQYFIINKFNLEGGIQLGYIINRKEKIIKNPFNHSLDSINKNNQINYDKFDLGINIGLGYNLIENLRVNIRYFLGLIERDNLIKPSVFSLGIEYEL